MHCIQNIVVIGDLDSPTKEAQRAQSKLARAAAREIRRIVRRWGSAPLGR